LNPSKENTVTSNPTRFVATAATLIAVMQSAAMAEDAVKLLPSPGGQIAIVPSEQTDYDDWKYAPARRAGDYVYVSGTVVIRPANVATTPETFKAQTRLVFQRLRERLQALGADFGDVVMINSFHDWSAPEFHGDRKAQFDAFNSVKEEFMGAFPHPAWTAVGTSGLIRTDGIVEVQMIAYAPQGHPGARRK
jgi:enamine deaminase RidA (YjgF/YER057c/UK114 family)